MDKIIMPELIPSELAKVIAENPEILKSFVDYQSNEEVIIGQNCTLDCGSNPTNVKLVFCNVAIGFDEEDGECGREKSGEQTGRSFVKIGSDEAKKKVSHRAGPSAVTYQSGLDVAVLEARINVIEKILKMIPRQASNRRLVARCKAELNEASAQLVAKKNELEYICKAELREATEQLTAKNEEPEFMWKEELNEAEEQLTDMKKESELGDESTEFWES